MPSFARLAAVSTLALAALTSAAPVAERQLASSLPDILTGLLTQLTPVTGLLSSVTSDNATAAVVGPLTSQVSSILNGAVSQVSNLAGQPTSAILGTADGVLNATGVANLIQPVMSTTLGALNDVLAVANDAGVTSVIQPLLNEAGSSLGPILTTATPLVNGLLAAAAPVLSPLLSTVNDLGLGDVLNVVEGIL
ncbi:hypothetical protein HMN09_01234900 [Mycena chlorophos]|uniref:PE-PGRS family protein n=1 Tax=Mycena chlorophos TaxID=658473 RepID=A0A8H6VVL4_MYCCL|nr:hypothetical protein HMN09_01234900 [Mycena chlorophos]